MVSHQPLHLFVFAASIFFLSSLGVSGTARADSQEVGEQCVRQACFPSSVVDASESLELRGVAEFRYWGFSVYAAALYAPAQASIEDIRSARVPKELRITYFRDFTRRDFIESGQELISENPTVSSSEIQPLLSVMNSLYRDVREGDTYTLRFEPFRGVDLKLNGELLGTVGSVGSPTEEAASEWAGVQRGLVEQFAQAYFGIWLSDYSINKGFTRALLGKG